MNIYKKSALVLAVVLVASAIGFTTANGYGSRRSGSNDRSTTNEVVTVTTVTTPAPVGQVLGAEDFQFLINLSLGMQHSDIMELQRRLRTLEFFDFPNDTGYFGPITLAAVKKYQAANGIINTGFVGPLTRASLNAK